MNEPDDPTLYRITPKGLGMVWAWIKLELNVHELTCGEAEMLSDDDVCPMSHAIALALTTFIPTVDTARDLGWFD